MFADGAGGDRAGEDFEIRGRVSRATSGGSDEPRRQRSARAAAARSGRHRRAVGRARCVGRAVQRPRGDGANSHRPRRRFGRRDRRAAAPLHHAGGRFFAGTARGHGQAGHRAGVRRSGHRLPPGLGRRAGILRRVARPRGVRQRAGRRLPDRRVRGSRGHHGGGERAAFAWAELRVVRLDDGRQPGVCGGGVGHHRPVQRAGCLRPAARDGAVIAGAPWARAWPSGRDGAGARRRAAGAVGVPRSPGALPPRLARRRPPARPRRDAGNAAAGRVPQPDGHQALPLPGAR